MTSPIRILIIGNGFGGTYVLKSLHKFFHKDKGVELSLIGEKNYFLFTPLLHEVATGGINPENIIEPIRKVLGCCLKNFYLGKAEFIDLSKQAVTVEGKIVHYDYLVLAPGAQTNFFDIPGAEKYSFPLKSIDDALKIKNKTITQMEKATNETDPEKRKRMLNFVVVGGGPTGIELATELQELVTDNFIHYYPPHIVNESSIMVIQRDAELIPQFGKKMRDKSLQVLNRKGIKVMLNSAVKEISDSYIILGDDTKINSEMVIWTAGIKTADLNFDRQITKSPTGKIPVNSYLQMESCTNVYALGDIASFTDINTNRELPALAQVAEKEAIIVAENIKRSIKGKTLKPFTYRHSGTLVSLGQWMAIGEMFHITISGGITWWIWRTVYLSKLISFRKKVRVAFDWTVNIFASRDISQI